MESCPDVSLCSQNDKVQLIEFVPGTHLWCDMSTVRARPLIPVNFRKQIFLAFHNLRHPGPRPTVKKVEERYFWPTLRKDVTRWANECRPCQEVKVGKTISPPTKKRPVGAPRFSDLQLDCVGPLPASEGMSYLLTIICRTTRYVDAVPMAQVTAEACAKAFLRSWVKNFGLPTEALCDNGAAFVSKLWAKVHDMLGTIVKYTPPQHPQSLGHLERQHRDLKASLKASLLSMAEKFEGAWMDILPWTILGRNTTYQPDLGASPADLVLGGCPRLPGDLVAGGDPSAADLEELHRKLQMNASREPVQTSHHREVPTYWPASAANATHVYLRKHKPTPLGGQYDGPLPIEEKIGDSCLKLRVGYFANGEPRHVVAHWNNCKPAVVAPGSPDGQRAPLGRPPNRTR